LLGVFSRMLPALFSFVSIVRFPPGDGPRFNVSPLSTVSVPTVKTPFTLTTEVTVGLPSISTTALLLFGTVFGVQLLAVPQLPVPPFQVCA